MLGVIHWIACRGDVDFFCVISKESGHSRNHSSALKYSTGSRNPTTKGEFKKESVQKSIAKGDKKTKANIVAGRSYSAGGVSEVRPHIPKIGPK